MNILFDAAAVQVEQQQETSTRLNTILGAIKSAGASTNQPWDVTITTPITTDALSGIDVFVSLTRDPSVPYAQSELTAITGYVNGGGAMLLMSNHTTFCTQDAILAANFGVTLQPLFISNPTIGGQAVHPMVMSFLDPIPCLTTTLSSSILWEVVSLISHDSCLVVPPATFLPIATFPSTAVDFFNGAPPSSPYFAIVVPPNDTMQGTLIVTGNAGMICDNGNEVPSCAWSPTATTCCSF